MHQPPLHEPAEQQADQGGNQAQSQQLNQEQPQGALATGAQTAQQGAGVIVTGGEAAGGQRYRDPRQDHGGDTGEPEELVGPLQGAADLPVVIGNRGQPLVLLQARFQPLPVGLQVGFAATEQQAIAYPATGLHDLGGLQVSQVHQHPGREAVEVAGAIRLVGKQGGNAQLGVTDFEGVADVEAKHIEQAWFDPQGARLGNARG